MTDLLARSKGICHSGDGWTARSPAHTDRHSNLSTHSGGRWLIKYHAGCRRQKVFNALVIGDSGFFDARGCGWKARSPNDRKLIRANKSWTDAANTITAEVPS